MNKNLFLFKRQKPLIAMVHVQALPGTPSNHLTLNQIIEKAKQEAWLYTHHGFDAIIIENMHDTPYLNKNIGSEITASMAVVANEIRKLTDLPCGIQILAGANKEALAVAHAANFDFIRAEGFVFSHIADEGFINSDAGELLRYRKSIGAEKVEIFTDIKKKHSSHSITSDISIGETAKAAEFFKSDGLIVTGNSTGEKAHSEDILTVKESTNLPVLVGSGISERNLPEYFNLADGFIIGSYLKKDGHWANDPDPERLEKIILRKEKLLGGI